jgi:hypothetical protein
MEKGVKFLNFGEKKFHLILMQILDIIGGIMVSMLTLSAVYHGFEPKASQTKD